MRHERKMTRTDLIVVTTCVVLGVLTLGAAGQSARQLARDYRALMQALRRIVASTDEGGEDGGDCSR